MESQKDVDGASCPSRCSVVLNIAFPNDRKTMDNWHKTVSMQRVPCIGERIWVLENEDYTVTDVWWNAETGQATVRCVEDNPCLDDDWISNLKESGFTKR